MRDGLVVGTGYGQQAKRIAEEAKPAAVAIPDHSAAPQRAVGMRRAPPALQLIDVLGDIISTPGHFPFVPLKPKKNARGGTLEFRSSKCVNQFTGFGWADSQASAGLAWASVGLASLLLLQRRRRGARAPANN